MQLLCVSWWISKLPNLHKILLFEEVLLPFVPNASCGAGSWLQVTLFLCLRYRVDDTYILHTLSPMIFELLWIFGGFVILSHSQFVWYKIWIFEKVWSWGITNPENLTSERIRLQPQMKLHLIWTAFDVCFLTERDNRTLKKLSWQIKMITLHSWTATIARGHHCVASTILVHVFFQEDIKKGGSKSDSSKISKFDA